ncbi:MAG TPA: CocE/NonD family hydrolase [Baekduia sp.]|nr:CocE/NonD family hydrolase [Baekduia sp.]
MEGAAAGSTTERVIPAGEVEPVYLGASPHTMLGLLHPSAAGGGRVPVLLCPPFGFEDVCSYRARRAWAQDLAARGHRVLRIDLPGTGDSAGGPRDAGLVRAWVDGVGAAARWLAATAETDRVAAIGVALGGVLARAAAAEGAPIGDLLLWGTPAGGSRVVREIRAFSRLERTSSAGEGVPDGALVSGGYLLAAETMADLKALDLTALDASPAPGSRALLAGRDDAEPDEALAAALAAAGYAVERCAGPGYGEMMDEPHLGERMPERMFATAGAWLAGSAFAPAEAGAAAPGQPVLELGGDGGDAAVRERAFPVELPFGRLFGVLAEPAAAEAHGLCAVLLNAGAQRRIGPNRMWVEAARRWAARGVPTLRLDVANVGDGDADGQRANDVEGFYVPSYGEQVAAALDALQAAGHGERFVLMGLCSGGYWAFRSCLDDDRAVAAVMLNPGALVFSRQRLVARQGRRVSKLRHARVWKRLLRGEVPRRDLQQALRGLLEWPLLAVRGLPARLSRRRQAAAPADPVADALDRFQARGRRGVLLLGPQEQPRLDLERDGHVVEFPVRWPAIDLQLLGGEQQFHELQPLPYQRTAHELADALLERALEDERGAALGASAPA